MKKLTLETFVYTVRRVDERAGLMGIARRLFGDASRWPEIYEANRSVIGLNPNVLLAGQQLRIARVNGEHVVCGRVLIYEVQAVDVAAGLRSIARRLCGDESHWEEIYSVNRGVIGDQPDRLQVGQRLLILTSQ